MKNYTELSEEKCALIFGGKDETTSKIVHEIARIIGSVARTLYNIRQLLKLRPV